ncbi:transporter [Limibaculum sp. M0105]|uniref:Transporter n=1 Tax=Thermohalobaculum xanthum TaxID=2753746 RepID=A0A8J7M5I1_9RHOB|nr:transporter [Thermohalobaculum xanthum]MBK0398553.1 transporter [Thermohalobaculum xanthum]
MRRLSRQAITAAIVIAGALTAEGARAAEGASSHYLPGTAGDFAIALSPAPGFQIADIAWFQSGSVGAAVLQGQVDLDLSADVFLNLAIGTYTWGLPVPGLTYTVGAVVPFGYASIDATLRGPLGNTFRTSDDSFDLSDIAFVPFQLNWNTGNFHFKLAQAVIAPTGGYDVSRLANLGRNYWSFDSVGAVTWLDQEWGTEVSIAPGIMVNTRNDATDYKTGAEFHMDFTVNQFLSQTFAIGLKGYWYDQVTGDSGSGARLGSFKSESVGLGPGFLWSPAFAGGRLNIYGKWMHDIHAKNRLKSDYGTLGIAWKF